MQYKGIACITLKNSNYTRDIGSKLYKMVECSKSYAPLASVVDTFPETYKNASSGFLGNLACLFLEDKRVMEDIMQDVDFTFIDKVSIIDSTLYIYYYGNKCSDFFNQLKDKSRIIESITLKRGI